MVKVKLVAKLIAVMQVMKLLTAADDAFCMSSQLHHALTSIIL